MANLQARTSKARRATDRPVEELAVPRDPNVVSAARALGSASSGAGRRASLARQTRSLQRSHGNQHVQRLIIQLAPKKKAKVVTEVIIPTEVEEGTIEFTSKTLEGLSYSIGARREVGEGGIRDLSHETEVNAAGIATKVTIKGQLFRTLPVWKTRDSRPAAERKEWDRFLGVVTKHENKHVAIAKKHLRNMKRAVGGGLKEEVVNERVAFHAEAMGKAQEAYDTKTTHGIKEGARINLPETP
jgi:hypothetical protein